MSKPLDQEYVAVVLRGERYKGWVVAYAGLGTLQMQKGSQSFRIDSHDDDWTQQTWKEAKARIDSMEAG